MSFTKPQLSSKNKDAVIQIALDQQARLEALTSGPITADMVKGEMLSIKNKAVEIKSARKDKDQAFKLAIAEIEADKEKAIAKLKLEHDSEDGVDVKDLEKSINDLETRSLTSQKDLTFGLEKAENDAKIKMDEIEATVKAAKETAEEAINQFKESSAKVETDYKEYLEKSKTLHNRTVEQTKYDNAIALRDLDEEFINKAADKLDMSIIENDKLKALRDFKEESEESVVKRIKDAEATATSKAYAAKGAEYNKLKNSSEKEIALLGNDNTHLKATLTAMEARNQALEAQVKEFPTKIAEAVGAAKSEVTVNQDAAKK